MTVRADTDVGFLETAPMEFDRTLGWKYFRDRGDVFEAEGTWYLTSAEAVRFATQHPDIFSSAGAYESLGSPVPLIPIAVDPPEHHRYRHVLDPMFAPRVINQLEEDLRRQVSEMIDAFADRGSCEVVSEIAIPYPCQVFMTMFGLPLEDRDTFVAWTRGILGVPLGAEPSAEQVDAGTQLFAYLQEVIEAKRSKPGDDVLSSVLALEGEDALTDEQVLGMCFLFINAGLDTVTSSIGFTMLHLATHEDLRRQVVADPDLAGPVIEEVLRLELPAPTPRRWTTRDVEVGGRVIPKGAFCTLVLATANRDPEWGPSADQFDLELAGRGHLSFGGGIHRCVGAHLARRELRYVVDEFHRRIPDYSVPADFQPRIKWPSATFHLLEVPMQLEQQHAGMKVVIDGAKCAGHGRCYSLAPELFADDDEGYGVARDGGAFPPELLPKAREGVACCPERAISISDGG